MKKLLSFITILSLLTMYMPGKVLAVTCNDTFTPGSGYSYAYEICADSTKAGSTDTANFAMVISGTYGWMATTGSGGRVNNTTTQTGGFAGTVPADLIFASDTACTTKLNWEYDSYNSATGAVNIWVNIGTLSHTATTKIYACVGKSSVTTWQGNVTGTWDSDYAGVYHFTTVGGTYSNVDSTTHGNTATGGNSGNISAGTGLFGGSISSLGHYYDYYSIPPQTYNQLSGGSATMSVWVYPTVDNPYQTLFSKGDGTDWVLQIPFGSFGNGHWTYGGGPGDYIVAGANALNTWHYAVLVANASNNTIKVYLDGNLNSTSANTSYATDSQEIRLLGNLVFTSVTGDESEFRMSGVVRSPDQILAEYNNQSSPSTFYSIGTEQAGGGGGGGVISKIINFIIFGWW